jgi:hypothetical protein
MMRLRAILHASLLLAGIFLNAEAASAESVTAARRILSAGRPTVLIVAPQPAAANRASEGYADWAAYLNDFAAERRGTFRFVRVTPKALRAIFAASTPMTHPFATIFIRDARNAVFYDGMIHEPQVYRSAIAFLSGATDPQTVALGLKPFRFRLR